VTDRLSTALADAIVLVTLSTSRPDDELRRENLRAVGMNDWTEDELMARLAAVSAMAGALLTLYAEEKGTTPEALAQYLALSIAQVSGP